MALITYLTKIQFDFGALALLIAIPTTAGTGSEVGRGGLITLADRRKPGLVSPHLIPKVAIYDPELTRGLPAGLAEMGLPAELIPDLAVAATRDHYAETNLRAASVADYEALFREAMG